jgi:hypothetical protein
MVAVVSIHQTYSANSIFRVYRTRTGRWCASTGDGAIGGVFFERSAALRFAEREGDGRVVVLDGDLASHFGPASPGPTIAKC